MSVEKQIGIVAAAGVLASLLTAGGALAGPPMAPPAQMINNFYFEGYGGMRLANNLDYDGVPYDLASGPSFGATFGVDMGSGLSFDIDAMQTNSYYVGYATTDNLNSTSLMVDANYTAWLNDNFGLFGGAGVGIIHLDYDQSEDTGNGAGMQAKVGLIAKVADSFSVFTEVKYQAAIGGSISVAGSGSPYPIEYNTTSVLTGIRFSMP